MKKLSIVLAIVAGVLTGCVVYDVPDRGRSHDRYYRDRDGVPNHYDRDRDGDGVRNRYDQRPDDPRRY